MSSISSASGVSAWANYASVNNTQKTKTSSIVDNLFEKLDTKGQGFLDQSELQAALSSASTSAGSSSASANDMFSAMDTDGDGKITKAELTNTLQSVMDKTDNLAASMRVHGHGRDKGGKGTDEGLTKDQLVKMATDTSTTDSKASAFMSNIADNFTAADTNGDGKVTRDEAMTYVKASEQASGTQTSTVDQTASGAQLAGGPPPSAPLSGNVSAGSDDSSTTASASTDPADTNGDGKVSPQEAINYLLSQLASAEDTSKTDGSSLSSTKTPALDEQLSRQIMQLVKTYGTTSSATAANDASIATTSISASA